MSLTFEDIQKMQEEKSRIFDEIGKYPEREQELTEKYWSIENEITRFYKSKNQITKLTKGDLKND